MWENSAPILSSNAQPVWRKHGEDTNMVRNAWKLSGTGWDGGNTRDRLNGGQEKGMHAAATLLHLLWGFCGSLL